MATTTVLIISDYFYPHWTGIAKSFGYLLPHLVKRARVHVLTVQHEKNLPTQEEYKGAHIVRVPYQITISRSQYSFRVLPAAIRMIQKAEVVVINSPSANLLPLSILVKIFRKKLILFHHGDLVLPKGGINFFIEKIFAFSFWCSAMLADKIGTYTQDYVKHSPVMKKFLYKVSCNILPIPYQQSKKKCANKKLQHIQKKGDVLIGFAGRFVEEKGFDILLDCMPALLAQNPRTTFVFAGQLYVAYENFFKKQEKKLHELQSHIVLLGLLQGACLQEFYKTIDLLVVPSRTDCFNLVQAEAMLAGTPIVVSDIPGARFLVQQTHFGEIFDIHKKNDLIRAIHTVLGNREKIQRNYYLVKKLLNEEKNAAQFTSFILD